jgi:Na+-transporting NADH:ubiquinone oxidoreductase subunit NqrC
MSVARLSRPSQIARPIARPAALRSVSTSTAAKPAAKGWRAVARLAVVGIIAVNLLSLVLNISVSQSAYELAHLKADKAALGTQVQILAGQVDSLSSQQNLANSAASLGMIANANPVFLRVADAKVFGKPKEALSTAGRVANNNLANAALTDRSLLTVEPVATKATSTSNVVTQQTQPVQVAFSSGLIPASPTH